MLYRYKLPLLPISSSDGVVIVYYIIISSSQWNILMKSIENLPKATLITSRYMKIHIFALRWKDEIRRSSQLRTLLKLVVVSRTWKKFQARTGFEPMTSAIPVQRSTNWANKPTGSWSMNWVQINIRVNEDLDIWKFTYLHCSGKMKLGDPRS